jgi:uncharacterized protein
MPMKPAERIVPFYFGPPDKRLFGCCHEPTLERRRKCAVVVCQPIGHEYVNSHRALRQLASRLCYAGFAVLRFDYYGCGDSSGSTEEGRIPQWLEDISTAVSQVRRRTAAVQVCLIGLRVGAALAMMSAAERTAPESLVLWDPVVNGNGYLNGLQRLQKEMLRFRPKPSSTQDPLDYMDVLGFPVSRFLQAELKNIDPAAIGTTLAKNVLVIRTDRTTDEAGLQKHVGHLGSCFEYRRLDGPQIWLPTTDGSLTVPSQILQSIVSWTSRVHA